MILVNKRDLTKLVWKFVTICDFVLESQKLWNQDSVRILLWSEVVKQKMPALLK